VRREALAADIGTMGPPVILPADPRWRPVVLPARGGAGEAGQGVVDLVASSWHPYYYRAVAIGPADLPSGVYAGESPPSVLQSAILIPPDEPALGSVAFTDSATNGVLTFTTDLPLRPSPLGPANIVVSRLAPSADGSRMERTTVLSVATNEVPESGVLPVLRGPTAAELAAMPEISRESTDPATGLTVFSVRLAAQDRRGSVAASDPLGRTVIRDYGGAP
jgi:hypothetical protein